MMYYTSIEGGMWKELPFSAKRQSVIRELKRNWVIARRLGVKMTYLRGRYIHSVRFSDGRIWDSEFGGYRPFTWKKFVKWREGFIQSLKS